MASVKISKGDMTKEVSLSSYENFFKNSGWEIAGNKKPATSQSKKEKVEEKKEDPVEEKNIEDEWAEVLEEEEEEGIEKPLSEMNKKELIEYAEKNGISLEGLTTNSQFRQAIQEYLREV